MMKVFYFEVSGFALDNKGNDLPAYMRFAVDGYCDAEIARAYAAEKLHIQAVLDAWFDETEDDG